MIYVSMIRTVALQSYAAALVFARSAHGNLYTETMAKNAEVSLIPIELIL
ncbi:hypothetical protein [Pseudoalteromonas maricaloris]